MSACNLVLCSINTLTYIGLAFHSRMAQWHEVVSHVPRKGPYDIALSRAEARELERRASKYTL